MTNAHYFRIDVLECVSGGAPRRICVDACTPDAVGGTLKARPLARSGSALLREAMRSAERGRAGGGVAHLRSAEGCVGRL